MRTAIVLAVASVSLSACVLNPADGHNYVSRNDPVTVTGYASQSNTTIQVQCRRTSNGSWLTLRNSSSNNYADNPGQSTLLYGYYETVQIPNACWVDLIEFGYSATLRVREPSAPNVTNLYTFTRDQLECVARQRAAGREWVSAASGCSPSKTTLTVYAGS